MRTADPTEPKFPTPATPVRMLLVVALLGLIAFVAVRLAMSERSWPYALAAALAALACVATAMLKPWSRFLVYLVNLACVAVLGYSVYIFDRTGVLRTLSAGRIVRSLAPATVMVLLICYCSYVVFINFRHRK
jgi:hypothetical protein